MNEMALSFYKLSDVPSLPHVQYTLILVLSVHNQMLHNSAVCLFSYVSVLEAYPFILRSSVMRV